MNRVVPSALAILLVAGLAGAATVTCPAPPNSSGVPADVTGLTIDCGGLAFSNFQVIGAAGVMNPVVSLVSADLTNGMVNLSFNPNLSAPTGAEDIHFLYQVTGNLNGVDLTVGGVNATVIERVCSAPIPTTGPNANVCPSGTSLANMVAFSNPPGPNFAVSNFSTNASTVYIYKDLGVKAGDLTPGGAALTSFTQSFQAVPEPASMLLIGTGFIALGMLRRRVRRG